MDNDVKKMSNKSLKLIILIESTIIALGALSVILITLFYEDKKHDRRDNSPAFGGSDLHTGDIDSADLGNSAINKY